MTYEEIRGLIHPFEWVMKVVAKKGFELLVVNWHELEDLTLRIESVAV